MARQPTREAFHAQARACEKLGSPFMARLCDLVAAELEPDQGPVARRMLQWPADPSHVGDAVPLRFAAALHGLVLSGAEPALAAVYPPHDGRRGDHALWSAVAAAMNRHEGRIQDWLDRPPQTNEVRRAAALYLGLLHVARAARRPVVLSEFGASAGLNLNLDRYVYRFGAARFGDTRSPVSLAPAWRGPAPPPAEVVIAARAGCDLTPLDVTREGDRLRLLSYIWADQGERLALTARAMEIAARLPVPVERLDAVTFVRRRLAAASAEDAPGAVHVVAHSIMWQYLKAEDRAAITQCLEDAGARAGAARPLAWLRLEPDGRSPGAALSLTWWPEGGAHTLARCDFHGRWIEAAPA